LQGHPCFNKQIGLCPGVCTGEISAKEYARTIRHLKLFFEGKKKTLLRELTSQMKTCAKKQEFEKANGIKQKIFALQHIQDVSLIKQDTVTEAGVVRIESFDVAHTSGTETVGVMTVVERGMAKKSDYRMFKLRGSHKGDDISALKELLTRRLKHPEWPYPNILAVDGGVTQFAVAQKVLQEMIPEIKDVNITLVAVTKNDKHRPEKIIGDETAGRLHPKEILLANSESHRFAITFHRKRRGKLFLKGGV
jgi:excinuclease ABC subunit C